MVDISTSRKRLSPSLRIPSTIAIISDAFLNLMTSNSPKMDWYINYLYFNYGHNVTFNFADCSVSAVCSLHL